MQSKLILRVISAKPIHNNNFKACDQNLLARLKPKDKVFCNAYSNFIGKLLDANWDEEPAYWK